MTAHAHAQAAPTAAPAANKAGSLQRANNHGTGADPADLYGVIAAGKMLGAGSGLVVGSSDDAFEKEADRVADRVMAKRDAGQHAPPGSSAERQRQTGQMGEDEIRMKAAAGLHRPTDASSAPAPAAASFGGRPLDSTTRAGFEPYFRRDLSHVRLHDDATAQSISHAIEARAFTHGNDIYFAAGQLKPHSHDGRKLLAHEIAHTLQPGATNVLRRAPEPEPATPAMIIASDVTMIILENPTGARHNVRYVNQENGQFTFFRPVYSRDSVHLALEANFADAGDVQGPLTVRFGAEGEFERSDGGGSDPDLTLRVLAEPDKETEARVFVSAPNVQGEMEVVFPIGVLPLDIDPVKDARQRKRGERRTLRQSQRVERQKLRTERRAGDESRDFKSERSALRKEQRAERNAFRAGRRKALGEAREERGAELAAARSEHGKYACSASQRDLVETAMREAIGRLESALSHIKPGEALDDYRIAALKRCFNIDPATANPAELSRLQIKALDVLNIARNSMLLSSSGSVRCGAPPGECKPRAGAFVQDNVRGNTVTLCQIWLDDNMKFAATELEPGHERAYALIHEFCHLAGVTDQSSESYLHEGGWSSLDAAEAETMADAFAAFAWLMSSPGLE